MHHITLDSETDFAGWRDAARALVLNHVKPADVAWTVQGRASELFAPSPPLKAPQGTFNVPAKFVALARSAIPHRDGARFALLYRLLWRLTHDHDLLETTTDPDVARITARASAVQHDVQRLQASLRFREIGREHKAHRLVRAGAPHHRGRRAVLRTPLCRHALVDPDA